MGDDEETSARNDLGQVLDTLVAMRADLAKTVNGCEDIPEIVKTHMKWADGELELAIASLKMFLGGRGLPS